MKRTGEDRERRSRESEGGFIGKVDGESENEEGSMGGRLGNLGILVIEKRRGEERVMEGTMVSSSSTFMMMSREVDADIVGEMLLFIHLFIHLFIFHGLGVAGGVEKRSSRRI